MKTNLIVTTLVFVFLVAGCGQGDKVNARNDRSLMRSMNQIERRLPKDQQVEFQVSFWSLKQYAENETEFRKKVHRKSVTEIVELGKQNFGEQVAAGNPEFTKFGSWEEMIAILVEERNQSELRPKKTDPRDKGNTIHDM